MLKAEKVPILEYDPCHDAVINPSTIAQRHPSAHSIPDCCVMAFLHKAVEDLVARENPPVVYYLPSVCGEIPVYRMQRGETSIALLLCPIGAPMAAGIMEEMHALGVKYFISCGGVGVLDKTLDVGSVLLPDRALRDEGTSYHYLPPDRFVSANKKVLESNIALISQTGVEHKTITTWTTDAFYRETRDKVDLRKSEGCSCVEMECAAFMAVAQHRNIDYGAILYAGDNLDGEVWDNRDWHNHNRRDWLLETAILCAARLSENQQNTVQHTEK